MRSVFAHEAKFPPLNFSPLPPSPLHQNVKLGFSFRVLQAHGVLKRLILLNADLSPGHPFPYKLQWPKRYPLLEMPHPLPLSPLSVYPSRYSPHPQNRFATKILHGHYPKVVTHNQKPKSAQKLNSRSRKKSLGIHSCVLEMAVKKNHGTFIGGGSNSS